MLRNVRKLYRREEPLPVVSMAAAKPSIFAEVSEQRALVLGFILLCSCTSPRIYCFFFQSTKSHKQVLAALAAVFRVTIFHFILKLILGSFPYAKVPNNTEAKPKIL